MSSALSRRFGDHSSRWQRTIVSEWPTNRELWSTGLKIHADCSRLTLIYPVDPCGPRSIDLCSPPHLTCLNVHAFPVGWADHVALPHPQQDRRWRHGGDL